MSWPKPLVPCDGCTIPETAATTRRTGGLLVSSGPTPPPAAAATKLFTSQQQRDIIAVRATRLPSDHADTANLPDPKYVERQVAAAHERLHTHLRFAMRLWAEYEKNDPESRALTLHAPMAASIRLHVQYSLPTAKQASSEE